MKIFVGEIFDNEFEVVAEDDICPTKLRHALEGLSDGEEIELDINSIGGSVIAGNAMISQLREAQAKGHKVVSKVHGLAASMGSAIACAADELVMDENAVMMLHNPWTMACGNQNDLRKEADTLELLAKTLVQVYKTKFPTKTEDEIKAMMDAETWILATDAEQYGLVCEIDHSVSEPLKIAAKWCSKFKTFKKVPEVLNMTEEEVKNEEVTEEVTEETTEETKEGSTEVVEEVKEEVKEEEKAEDPDQEDIEELRKTIEILKEENEALKNKLAECEKEKEASETVSKAECEKRVSGMQSSMQKQINDFKDQLKAKDEELTKAMALVTSLTDDLKNSTDELQKMTSAFEEKTQALDKLNANVNAATEELPTFQEGLAKCSSPSEKVQFIKSGKYVM